MMLGVDDDHSVNYEKGQRPTKRKKKQLNSFLFYLILLEEMVENTQPLRLAVLFVFGFPGEKYIE